jgi:hypothetical protein
MKRPFYPLLFAIYPVLALLAHNIDQIKASAALRALTASLVGAVLLWLLLRLILKDWDKAALLTTLLWMLFFTYGHIYHSLEANPVMGMTLGRHRLLIPLWLLIAALGAWLVIWKIKNLASATQALNILGMVALAFPILQLLWFNLHTAWLASDSRANSSQTGAVHLPTGQAPPDIYYIILDAYSRDDVLQRQFGYHNQAFIQELEELGFYVARCSQSNYAQTQLSMASSLNIDYLDNLVGPASGSQDMSLLWPLIRHSTTRQALEEMGYTIVAFETGYYWLHLEDADVYFSPERSAVNPGEAQLAVNGFEAMLIRESAGLALTDAFSLLPRFLQPDLDAPVREHRQRVLYVFDKLRGVPLSVESPKFIYAHIVAPHFPIVFGPNGEDVLYPEPLDEATYATAYPDEITYVNQRVLDVVKEIIQVSATPPVIIIQADHGNDHAQPADRTAILNAYYLPGGETQLYPTITPVNTFRMIFNQYFGGNYILLDDVSYYSTYQQPYQFEIIQNDCASP